MTTALRDKATSLWVLAAPPSIWAAHFLLSYITAAIVCEKSAVATTDPASAQVAIAVYTAGALLVTALIARWGWRHHAAGGAELSHDDDSPGDRERFLGFATFLLAGLVAVAVIYLALSVALAGTCR
jgi:hypothetical protein